MTIDPDGVLRSVPWPMYRGAWYRFIARRESTGYSCLLGRIVFAVQKPQSAATVRRQTEDISIESGWLDLAQARAALRGVPEGRLVLAGSPLSLQDPDGKDPVSSTLLTYLPRHPYRDEWPGRVVRISGRPVRTLVEPHRWEDLDRRFASRGGTRFRGWGDIGVVVNPRVGLTADQNRLIDIEFPVYARLASPRPQRAGPHVAAEIESLVAPSQWKMEVVCFPEERRTGSRTIPARKWQRVGRSRWRAETEWPRFTGGVVTQLIVRGEVVDSAETGVPSPLMALHLALDPKLEWLREHLGLGAREPDAAAFECAVNALLALAGCTVVHYGFDKRRPLPDLVFRLAGSTYGLGECSIRPPTPSDIDNLRHRLNTFGGVRADGRIVIVGAFFMPRPWDEVSPETRRRGADTKIGIIPRHRLEALLKAATRGDAREARQIIVGAVLSQSR